MELFDSTKRSLYDILKDVKIGKIQLPDFQRGWIWDDFRIRGLLASIAKSFPIGAVMLLETGNNNLNFKTRPVESVIPGTDFKNPEELILDGQQRITSLYQTIISNQIVKTKNEKKQEIRRWYYIDMQKTLDPSIDLEEAIMSINENKQITRDFGREVVLDLSTEELEFKNLMYPVYMIDEYDDWREKFEQYWDYNKEKIILFKNFKNEVITNFKYYQLPVIVLKKENSREAVCQVFEKVNTGGVSLNVFELLTAVYASDSFDLRENWENIKKDFGRYNILKETENTDFLQAVTLLSTYFNRKKLQEQGETEDRLPAVTCKRKDVLALTLSEYKTFYDKMKKGFLKSAQLLNENYIFKSNDLPYYSQLVPLAAVFAYFGDEADNFTTKKKIMQWYWCGVLGELYGGANETRYALDIQNLISWIKNDIDSNDVKTVYDANFNPSRLNTLKTRNSAAYKGIYSLLINEGAKDWINGSGIDITNYFSEFIDIHHIFPRNWCEKPENKIPSHDFDSIINKTPLSSRSNKIIGGDAPSKYLVRIEKKLDTDRDGVSELLKTHLIEPKELYEDNFYSFFNARRIELLKLIGKAMNKPIDFTIEEVEQDTDDYEEDDIEQNNVMNGKE